MLTRHYFKILGLEPGASHEEVRKAYRNRVKIWHPDRFCHSPWLQQKAERKLKEINLSYEHLISKKLIPKPFDEDTTSGKRGFPRKDCSLNVNYTTNNFHLRVYRDAAQNISASGLFINTEESFPVNRGVLLSLSLPTFGDLYNIPGTIVRSIPTGIGIKFKISNQYRKFISRII